MPNVSSVRNAPTPCMSLEETTRALHVRVDTLMAWLQRGDCPFGTYVKKLGRHRGHYLIVRARFEKYMAGEDMGPGVQEDGNETA